MVDLLDFVPIVGHVGRPTDVVVLPDDRYVFDQIQSGAEEPLVALGPLGVAHVLVEPALHERVEAVMHGFRDGGVRLKVEEKRERVYCNTLEFLCDLSSLEPLTACILLHSPEFFF